MKPMGDKIISRARPDGGRVPALLDEPAQPAWSSTAGDSMNILQQALDAARSSGP